jgi:hypothetical protein
MTVASFGRYLPVSGRDHETARAERARGDSQVVNVASIMRRRAELARWLRDLSKTDLLYWMPPSLQQEPGRKRKLSSRSVKQRVQCDQSDGCD